MAEPPLPPTVRHVAAVLAEHGLRDRVRMLDEKAPSAAVAASLVGCAVGAIANSLVFDAEGAAVLILASGAHRVDTGKAAAKLGVAGLRRANPDFVREATGQPIGGVAPVGHPSPLPTLIDEALGDHPEIWAAGGHPHALFPTTFAELRRLTGATPARVGEGNG